MGRGLFNPGSHAHASVGIRSDLKEAGRAVAVLSEDAEANRVRSRAAIGVSRAKIHGRPPGQCRCFATPAVLAEMAKVKTRCYIHRLGVILVFLVVTYPALAENNRVNYLVLPPTEYDYPFKDTLVTLKKDTRAEVNEFCRTPLAMGLGRVDGFDRDEAECQGYEGGVVLRGLLASECDAFEALEFADGLLDACPRLVEYFRKECWSIDRV